MNIYIDESGSFAHAETVGRWNVVAALVVPESARRPLTETVRRLKARSGITLDSEAKLNVHSEADYLAFLAKLAKLPILLFCTAVDAGRNTIEDVCEHQRLQGRGILHNIDKMRHEGGRKALERMAGELEALPQQLYVQLTCQIGLMYTVTTQSILYFSQRIPGTLSELRWRIDQKDLVRTPYEQAFQRLSPPLIQSRSINEPMIMVHGFDYSHMQKYQYAPGNVPRYLKDDYAIDVDTALDAGKLLTGNIRFVDSKGSIGVQAGDLIASGVRKCLRGEFRENGAVAAALGRLMVQARNNVIPIDLVTFGTAAALPPQTASLVRAMRDNCRPMR
jgi:hypothetical protein